MKYELIGHGAEAKLYLIETNEKKDNYIFRFNKDLLKKLDIDYKEFEINYKENKIILKYRYKKKYRNEIIDNRLRKYRTRIEIKILEKLYNKVNVPELIYNDEDFGIIIMSYIDGYKLSEYIEKLDYNNILYNIGKSIGIMHKNNIVHGDLTTANMIYKDNNIYFIDFGLSFFSKRIEDFAVDIHLFKEIFKSNHWKIYGSFNKFIEGYKESFNDRYKDIIDRLKKVEARGRYKSILF
ncbi:serine/threonine protein kinase [Nanobdella aerobiophila]|uniref:non-specific serine/threonine protein kinase n=1 Tax=Nanobdella aerobiophila TaxID=2586965 RepID=A0A915SIA0_9ARCH|nr:KEOPS complex kinase/ATPase Bud32 [Nanobdella aerobiophila]BBL45497.1 serine/threonine protein kinase [Nanobdella aerobiophila]